MTEEDAPRATPTKKLFTNFKVYMHTWFPLKEEMEDAINETIHNLNNVIYNNIEALEESLSRKANKTEIPTQVSQLENDENFLKQDDIKNNLTSTDTQFPLSAYQGKILKDYIDNKFNNILDITYPIGSIYISINNQNPSTLFGGTWEQLQNRFLLGAGSQYANGATGGSKDAIVVTHTHTQNSHTHTQSSHRHSNPRSDDNYKFLLADENIAVNGTPRGPVAETNTGDWHYVYAPTKTGLADIVEYEYTAYATATNNSATATNQYTGESGTNKNMPPYLVVYMWKRIA